MRTGRYRRLHWWLCVVLLAGIAAAQKKDPGPDIEKRVDLLLRQMTLEEKLDYIGGYNEFYVRAIPRLGVPELKMADGPMGVRNYGPSTAYPAGIALAATWDPALVKRVGAMMGKDARARGVHFLLGPGMDIYRAPMCGRNFEYFGEDPYLAARTAVADIEGIQSQGVIATAKHYVANDQEWDRHRTNAEVNERALREIYLPPFEASVREAHVGAIMTSYNLLNGAHMSQNGYLNNDILRKQWGFTGVVMSDWDSTYDAVAAANGGLDLEMPSGKLMDRASLLPAIESGTVSEAVIDEKVRRILRTALEFSFFDRPQEDATIPKANPASSQTALDAALGGMVLLKNEGVLPFDKSTVKTIAVIGPSADPAITGGGGSSKVRPISATSVLQGVKALVGSGSTVLYAVGVPNGRHTYDATSFFTDANATAAGLKGEYFNNPDLKGTPALARTDEHVNFHWEANGYGPGAPAQQFSARWTGYYRPQISGDYDLFVTGDDGFRVYVDDALVIDRWRRQQETDERKSMRLESGRLYKVRLEYFQAGGTATIAFGIDRSGDRALQQAREAAAKADAVVLSVGFDQSLESEGFDRPFALPPAQEELIRSVLSANRNVAIVLTAGGNVDMNGWIDRTPALLHAWYPGQEGGTAIARILFGEVNPSGKLPVSFERRLEDNATFNSYYDPKIGPGIGGDHRDYSGAARAQVRYSEGIFLGYRHFDRSNVKPLFPFGFGLSYTTFKYANLKLTPASTDQVTVRFDVANTGKREGAEVAQVYVSEKRPAVERPLKELKGFAKVNLQPGESKTVTVSLDRRAFSYYDVDGKQWRVNPGEFSILVGGSSADIVLTGNVNLR